MHLNHYTKEPLLWSNQYHLIGISLNNKIYKYHYLGNIMDIDKYLKENIINIIVETELPRYSNFFENSYKENLEHSEFVKSKFPRWSIISGYYAMHDITKLFLVKEFRIKINLKIHKTTIKLLHEIVKDIELLNLLKTGYEEFLKMANDLEEAKEERMKVQYYTGTAFMKEKYREKADNFLINIVNPYIEKIKVLIQKNDIKYNK